jgi:hypothetical protein
MNTQDLEPQDFFELYTSTVQALVELNQEAMVEVMNKTDPAFSLFCMEEMLNRVAAAIISQKIDPEEQVTKFCAELNNKVNMCLQPKGAVQ